jgi:hypothetical protein
MKKSMTLQQVLNKYLINSYLAEKDPQYGYILSNKIREAIQKSVAVIVILTKNSIISASVNQEIGYALGLGMTIIPMVSDDVRGEVGVLLNDVEGEIFKEDDFESKCDKIAKFILKQIESLKISTSDDYELFNKERDDF